MDTVNQIVDDLDMAHIPQAIIFNKRDLNHDIAPTTNLPSVYVSTQYSNDIDAVKQLLFDQIKQIRICLI